MTYQEIFEKAKNIFMKLDVNGIQEKLVFQFDIVGEGEGIFYAEVKDGVLSMEPYEYYDGDAVFTCTTEVLFEIAEGELDPVMAFTLGKLKASGSTGKALKIKDMIGDAEEQKQEEPDGIMEMDSGAGSDWCRVGVWHYPLFF